MDAELIEIQNFLASHPPFDELPEETLIHVSQQIEIGYYREDTPIIHFGDDIQDLYMVRSGVVEIYRRKGELYNRIDEGDLFGQMGLLTNNKVRFPAKAVEDTLVYCIPAEVFQELYDGFDSFADFVEVEDTVRLRQTVSNNENTNDLTTSKVRTLLTRDAPTIERSSTIQSAARLMADEQVSSLLIIDPEIVENDEEDTSPVVGIITDRDLCTRVLAESLDPQDEVSTVMSTDVISLDHNAYVYEAMLTMLRYNVHHLPVLKNKKPLGIIETTDIVRYESQNSLLLVSSIFQQQSVEELKALSDQIRDSFVRLVNEDANAIWWAQPCR
ncbi:predicted signal-transduction protein containing cAMP-binding and CBS domains [Vibrio variabilis]|uniref:Predicted signal-transduction protein containing cAMP-binding and CBS domains n=1 Tax=Vibrio variabilis TaxID=990271 RepID=A0ABQ0JIP4_9VIBR|nr:predicted signal-transduction protein containing cAMP-binding and CBS domains [Vibrio variabilis]